MTLTYYLVLSAILFAIGATTVMVRRNAIIAFLEEKVGGEVTVV